MEAFSEASNLLLIQEQRRASRPGQPRQACVLSGMCFPRP